MEKLALSDQQKEHLLKYKKCIICHSNIKITIEFDTRILDYTSHFKCKKCGISGKLFGTITKQQFNNLTNQLLVQKKCIECYGDSKLDVEFNKEPLGIIFHITCKKCQSSFIIKKPCKSEEELEHFSMQIAESTLEDKGFVNVKVES